MPDRKAPSEGGIKGPIERRPAISPIEERDHTSNLVQHSCLSSFRQKRARVTFWKGEMGWAYQSHVGGLADLRSGLR